MCSCKSHLPFCPEEETMIPLPLLATPRPDDFPKKKSVHCTQTTALLPACLPCIHPSIARSIHPSIQPSLPLSYTSLRTYSTKNGAKHLHQHFSRSLSLSLRHNARDAFLLHRYRTAQVARVPYTVWVAASSWARISAALCCAVCCARRRVSWIGLG